MDNNTAVLSRLVERTKQLRISRGSQAPESIFDMSFTTQSIRTSDQTSIISSTFFTFDDELVNAPVYRRTLARAYAVLKMEEDTQQTDSDDVKTITGEGKPPQVSMSEMEIKSYRLELMWLMTSTKDDTMMDLR